MKNFMALIALIAITYGCIDSPIPEESIMDNENTLKSATLLEVPTDFATIQSAIFAANDGDIIKVKHGVYEEHIVIAELNDITLMGKGATITTPNNLNKPLILVSGCENFRITGFKIDGKEGEDYIRNSPYSKFNAIYVESSSGTISDNEIINFITPALPYQTDGMPIKITGDHETCKRIMISKNRIVNFDNVGIFSDALYDHKIHMNTLISSSNPELTFVGGLQFNGGTGSVTRNLVRGIVLSGLVESYGITISASAIASNNFRIVNNTIENFLIGVLIWDYNYLGLDKIVNSKLINNTFSGNEINWMFSEDDILEKANKVVE